ncbi:MAG: hypothetical protein DRJ67_02740 [Thermoprotei archaeon]|nr:MAG: hypothetical protein DRJ67_02740 [Thermoprotei archaeon]
MEVLRIRPPTSVGVLLSYKCTCECKHCMYACSPRWENRWISEEGLREVLEALAPSVVPASPRGWVGVNEGLHLTGGEPFLNYDLLLAGVKLAESLGYPSVFVETNCFWCVNDEVTRRRFKELREAGLEGVLISVNPFVVECVPYERIKRAITVAEEVFGRENVLVYHEVYRELLDRLGVRGTLRFEEYLRRCCSLSLHALTLSFSPSILLPMGRLVYTLYELYERRPAKAFFRVSCLGELTRPWHVHVDCYYNYVPGYCAGISLGDARRLEEIVGGVDLGDRPVLAALVRSLGELYRLAVEGYGYTELRGGYISPCHLCLDIRMHLALEVGGFKELQPPEFYEALREVREAAVRRAR